MRDFICHILVPEAAILLMMEDIGWTGKWPAGSVKWNAARIEASRQREKSVEYGRWKFRADGEEAEVIFRKLEERELETKRLVSRLHGTGSNQSTHGESS